MAMLAPYFEVDFRLAGNKDNHKISDEFEIWKDRTCTTDCGVSYP